MKVEQAVIIGAGPAGIAAGIQLKRSGFDPQVMEKNRIGGLLLNAGMVENYPGFPEGVTGRALVELFEAQLRKAGVSVLYEMVVELDHDGSFIVTTTERKFRSHVAVIASGTQTNIFEAVEIPEIARNRIFSEVFPIIDIRGQRVAVIGAGDAAFDYALHLSGGNEVAILNRSSKRKCLPLLWERSLRSSRISYRENVTLREIRADREGLVLICYKDDDHWESRADYVIFAIGRKPQLDFLSPRLAEKIDQLQSSGRLYLVGDVKNNSYRQTSIAVGEGVHAAMRICRMFQGAC